MKKRLHFDKLKDSAWRSSMRILLAGLAGISADVHADTPTGIIGGQDNAANAYAALILQGGTIAPVAGLPANSVINSVAINQTGFSIIGGENQNTSSAYAATVSSNGTLNPISLSLTGSINSVAINQGGTGLIGGQNFSLGSGYAAFILPDGTITPAAGFADVTANVAGILTAAVNDSSVGLIGGEGDDARTYAAYVALDGTVTVIPTPPGPGNPGQISRVAINAQGNGIIAGWNNNGLYAAFVTPAAGTPVVLSPIPTGFGGVLNAAAINNAGIGLIGGNDNTGAAYAGYSTAQGVVTPVIGSPFSGTINSVALNTSGAGIIGGQNGSNIYAGLVQPGGALTSINTGTISGQINWVAINDPGIGLIGGNGSGSAYAALVAPNGAVTLLNATNAASLNSVALSNPPSGSQTILSAATPKSIGPYLSAAYTQLAATYALQAHFIGQNNIWNKKGSSKIALLEEDGDEHMGPVSGDHEILASINNSDELVASLNNRYPAKSKSKNTKEPVVEPSDQNSIWLAPFGDYVHLKDQGKIPSIKNQIAGALLGYDHQGSNYLVGTCVGYAFNYISYGQSLGHGKLQEEMGSFYGSYFGEHFRVNSAVWGGFYQFWNTRRTLSMITSKSKTHGWILSPHLEMSTPWALDQKEDYFIEPFFSLDWVNSWQKRFTESGKSGLNLKVGSLYSSLLQSEVGVRFYERFVYGWGNFCLEEKISYVNQAPFHVNSVATSFVGAASSFPIAVASSKVQNLGALELSGSFNPNNTSYPYGGITLQAMANRTYQSYFATLFLGYEF